MSVHYGEDPVRGTVANTMKPWTRDGGGKNLRRRQRRLDARVKAFNDHPDKTGRTRPGSMQ